MKLHINGEQRDFADIPSPFTLLALVEKLGMKADRVAIELNLDIAPRDRWFDTALKEGDKLEIVHFVGGGITPLLDSSSSPEMASDSQLKLKFRVQPC
jgi:sulfur carrier protein